MSDQIKAGFTTFLFVLVTTALGYVTGFLDRADDWLTDQFPGNDVLVDSGKALAFALVVGAVNWGYRALQRKFTWLPGTPPTYTKPNPEA